MYKYHINELLLNLPKKDFSKALKVLPKALNISLNTFMNYRNIKVDEDRDIPYQKVVQLEQIFGLKPGGLANFKVEVKPVEKLLEEYIPDA